MESNLKELMELHGAAGVRYQQQLGQFIFDNKLETIVETGSGVSTLFILEALDKLGKGHLYSIDPFPFCQFEVIHPRYTLIKKKSFEALADLYIQTGAWDLFLHDSDHWIECQTFEYNVAKRCVRGNGFILSDDYEWDGHYSWKRFHEEKNEIPFPVGNIQGIKNTIPYSHSPYSIKEYCERQWGFAKDFGAKWRMLFGRNPCNSCGSEYSKYWEQA